MKSNENNKTIIKDVTTDNPSSLPPKKIAIPPPIPVLRNNAPFV